MRRHYTPTVFTLFGAAFVAIIALQSLQIRETRSAVATLQHASATTCAPSQRVIHALLAKDRVLAETAVTPRSRAAFEEEIEALKGLRFRCRPTAAEARAAAGTVPFVRHPVVDTLRVLVWGLGVGLAIYLVMRLWADRRALRPLRRGRHFLARNLYVAGTIVYIVGTEVRQLGHDMGYWRLPLAILVLVAGLYAVAGPTWPISHDRQHEGMP